MIFLMKVLISKNEWDILDRIYLENVRNWCHKTPLKNPRTFSIRWCVYQMTQAINKSIVHFYPQNIIHNNVEFYMKNVDCNWQPWTNVTKCDLLYQHIELKCSYVKVDIYCIDKVIPHENWQVTIVFSSNNIINWLNFDNPSKLFVTLTVGFFSNNRKCLR